MAPTLNLKLEGFRYEDVYCADRLPVLDMLFEVWLVERDDTLHARFMDYRNGV